LTESESVVLPLDDLPIIFDYYKKRKSESRKN
jgi:hypothetical protein